MAIDLSLAPKQVALQNQVREFVAEHCPRAYARELDDTSRFPLELWAQPKFRELLTLGISAGQGGAGLLELVIVCEELARGAPALGVAYGMSSVAGAWALGRFGTREEHRCLLRQCAAGGLRFAMALSEMEDGDPSATAEVLADGGCCVRGDHLLIPGADLADQLLIVARSDPVRIGTKDLTLLYVSPREPGITATPIRQMGQRALPLCEVRLDRVRTSPDALLGEPHRGEEILGEITAAARLLLAAVSTGLAQVAFEEALAHAREPRHGGQAPGHSQGIQHALAAAHTRIEAARLLVYHAACCGDAGESYSARAAVANYYASAAVSRAVETGIRIFGPSVNRSDCEMQRHFRDAVPLAAVGHLGRLKDLISQGLGV